MCQNQRNANPPRRWRPLDGPAWRARAFRLSAPRTLRRQDASLHWPRRHRFRPEIAQRHHQRTARAPDCQMPI
jgi:hypothetical protein